MRSSVSCAPTWRKATIRKWFALQPNTSCHPNPLIFRIPFVKSKNQSRINEWICSSKKSVENNPDLKSVRSFQLTQADKISLPISLPVDTKPKVHQSRYTLKKGYLLTFYKSLVRCPLKYSTQSQPPLLKKGELRLQHVQNRVTRTERRA